MPSNATANPHPQIGTELVREWVPQGEPRAAIVLVHGLAEHCGRYERTGQLLADAGYHVRSFDLIGAGGSGGARWDIDDWDRYHEQIQSHVEHVRALGRPVVLMGHSLGGNLALGYVLSERPLPDLLVLSAPALGDGGATWMKSVAGVLVKVVPTLTIPNPFSSDLIARDPDVVAAYEADPLVVPKSKLRLLVSLTEEMEELNGRLGELELLGIPTLVFHGGEDRLVPTHTSEPLGELECVDRRVYDGLQHETLNEPEGPEVVADIVTWLDERV